MNQSKIHPTAIIDPKAEIDSSNEIGPYCIIGPHVKMGPGNKLQSHVVIDNHTTIGSENIFYPFSVIGATPADLKFKGEPAELIIGNNNTIRESVSLHIGTEGGGNITRIGDHNLLMAYVHLGHDTQVGNRVIMANSCQIAGHVTIEDWAILGGMTAVSQFVRVGAHSYVGGCSGVDRDMPPFCLGKGPTGQFQILGLNLVGLRRRGLGNERISVLMEVTKIFSNRNFEKVAALQKIEELYPDNEEAKQFVAFVKQSEVGVYR